MNDVQLFSNSVFGNVRAIKIDTQVWFVGKDVAEALGYKDTKKAISTHCKEEGVTIHPLLTSGGLQDVKYINRRNVIRLIMRSKLPQAEAFQDWVEDEIIPSVLSTGSYSVSSNAAVDKYLAMSEEDRAIAYFTKVKESKEKQILIEQQAKQLEEQEPAVVYSNAMHSAINGSKQLGDFAKSVGYGPQKIFTLFKDNNIIFSSKTQKNVPYQRYIDAGYFEIDNRTRTGKGGKVEAYQVTLITPKGQQWATNKFSELKPKE